MQKTNSFYVLFAYICLFSKEHIILFLCSPMPRPILRSFLRNLCSRVHVCRPLWPCYAFLMSGLKWAEESISAYSWLFHAVAWTLPAAKTTFIIALGLVEVRNNGVNRYRGLTKVNSGSLLKIAIFERYVLYSPQNRHLTQSS